MKQLEESLEKHVRRLDREISFLRNYYCLPATTRHGGTMSAQDKRDLMSATGVREWISSKTSVLALEQGSYETTWNNLTDTPTKANEDMESGAPYCEIDVEETNTKTGVRKQIWFYQSGTGQIWYRNIHSQEGSLPQKWQLCIKRAELWKGEATEIGEKITLSDSLGHYTKIVVGYSILGGVSYKELAISHEMDVRDLNLGNNDENLWSALYEMVLYKENDTTLLIQSNKGILRSEKGESTLDQNKIKIVSIEGEK